MGLIPLGFLTASMRNVGTDQTIRPDMRWCSEQLQSLEANPRLGHGRRAALRMAPRAAL